MKDIHSKACFPDGLQEHVATLDEVVFDIEPIESEVTESPFQQMRRDKSAQSGVTLHGFEDTDLAAARTVADAAAAASVSRLVYLGALHPEGVPLSPHLASRVEVGEVFLDRAALGGARAQFHEPPLRVGGGVIDGPTVEVTNAVESALSAGDLLKVAGIEVLVDDHREEVVSA